MNRDEILQLAASELARFLQTAFDARLPKESWWQSHVLASLSHGQLGQVRSRNLSTLAQLDLAALLRVFQRNASELSHWCQLSNETKTLSHQLLDLRHSKAHESTLFVEPTPEQQWRDLDTVVRFLEALRADPATLARLSDERKAALARLAAAHVPPTPPAPAPTPPPPAPLPVAKDPLQPPPAELAPSVDSDCGPVAARLGEYLLHGPGTSFPGMVARFTDEPASATIQPWRVRGPGRIDLTVHLAYFDSVQPDGESGQIQCDSRNGSPQSWDDIVRRLRVGLRTTASGDILMDLACASPNPGSRPTRILVPLPDLSRQAALDVPATLLSLGATSIGTRDKLLRDTSRRRNYPCLIFPRPTPLPALAAWLLTTVLPLSSPRS